MPDITSERPDVGPGGLVTVAFLKARLDENEDHLGLFMPLVMDVLCHMSASFSTAEMQAHLERIHGIAMPQATLETLLKRAIAQGHLERIPGRYKLKSDHQLPSSNVAAEKLAIEERQRALGGRLVAHAASRGLVLPTIEAALDLLFAFLQVEQVGLLLDSDRGPDVQQAVADRERLVVAEFIEEELGDGSDPSATIQELLEGLVVYNGAFLPGLANFKRGFKDLRVFFDSDLVRRALGYEGEVAAKWMQETIALLKASGIQCFVFDKTLDELHRILNMYEQKLATSLGRASLYQSPMTRHFLTRRYSPSDIRQLAALLEQDVGKLQVQKLRVPPRVPSLTRSEPALARRLTNPEKGDDQEPRVMHDVNCVAGILTLRKGHSASAVEEARAVFATSSVAVIRSTRLWWEEDEHESAVPPMLHIRALTNRAWLKKPSCCRDFKLRELVALCAAAGRPTAATWRRFLKHLEVLVESKRLDSAEATSVVVSAMSDALLREAEMEAGDGSDLDAGTLDEVIERVKESYRVESAEQVERVSLTYEERLAQAVAERDDAAARALAGEQAVGEAERRMEEAITREAGRLAGRAGWTVQWVGAFCVAAGGGLLLCSHPLRTSWLGIGGTVCIWVFVGLEAFGIFGHLRAARSKLEGWLATRLLGRIGRRLRGHEGPGRTQPTERSVGK